MPRPRPRRRPGLRLLLAAAVSAGAVAAFAAPASASYTGSCSASAEFSKGPDGGGPFTISTDDLAASYVIPRKADVAWEASVPDAPVDYSGWVGVKLPAPFGNLKFKTWGGAGSSDTSDEGTESLKIPSFLPGGAKLTLSGEHRDSANGVCKGSTTLELEGSALGSPITWVSLVITLAAGVGLVAIALPAFTGKG